MVYHEKLSAELTWLKLAGMSRGSNRAEWPALYIEIGLFWRWGSLWGDFISLKPDWTWAHARGLTFYPCDDGIWYGIDSVTENNSGRSLANGCLDGIIRLTS